MILLAFIANFYVNRSLKPECEKPQTAQTGSVSSTSTPNPPAAPPCSLFAQVVIDIVPDLTVQFIAAFLTALFFLGFLILFSDDEDAVKDVRILYQPEQAKRHKEALKKTTFWYHDGHVASYVTSAVLPEFQRRSQKDRCNCKIKVAIMNPANDEVCQTYLEHINGLPKDERRYSDLNSVKARLCASIYLLVEGHQSHNLTVEIYLKDRIDFIRTDIADARAFWTTVGKEPPAISLINRRNKSVYYNLVVKNFKASIRHYKTLPVTTAHAELQQAGNHRQLDNIKVVLQLLFPNDTSLYNDDSLKRIAKYLPKS